MRSILIFACFAFVFTSNLKWMKETYPSSTIEPNGNLAMEFPSDSVELKYNVGCNVECNIFLMEKAAYNAFIDNRPHSSLKEELNGHHSFEHFYDQHVIAHGVTLVVVNPNPDKVVIATIGMEYLHTPHHYDIKEYVQLGVVGMLGACIFSLVITLMIACFALGSIFVGMWCGFEKEVNTVLERIWSNKKMI
jgi:hypothetical protein